MIAIGTRFKVAYSGQNVHEVCEPFSPSSELIHYKNLHTGDHGVTIERFCIRLKSPIKRTIVVNKTPIKRIK